MPDPLIIDGGILAGGLSRRMHGEDKGLQVFKDKPMALWVYEALSPHVRNVVINCNRNQTTYSKLTTKLTSDSISGFPGPLAGILSILEASDADYFLISPCDTPLLRQDFSEKMLNILISEHKKHPKTALLFAVVTGDKHHPLHLCISRQYTRSLKAYLEQQEHRVMKWMTENNAVWLDFTDKSEYFRNFNTLEEVNTY